jgi:hypothetical protein
MAEGRLKGVAGILVGAAALITAVLAIFRPETAARAGYDEHERALIGVEAVERQNHEDIVALRSYIDTYTKGHEVVVAPVVTTPPSPSPSSPVRVDAGAPQLVHASAPADAAPPPHVAPLPPPRQARSFDSL